MRISLRVLAVAASVAAIAGPLTACGGGSSTSATTSSGTGSASPTSSPSGTSQQQYVAAVTAGYAVINGLPTVVSAPAVGGGIATALVVGAVAGIYPALRAAALTPTEALRAA